MRFRASNLLFLWLCVLMTVLWFSASDAGGPPPTMPEKPLEPLTRGDAAAAARAESSAIRVPLNLSFEPNVGQAPAGVQFLSRARGYTLLLSGAETVFSFPERAATIGPHELRLKFVGANPRPRLAGTEEQRGRINYLVGRDPRRWKTNVPTYAKVVARGVYPAVDLVSYGREGALEFDFIIRPGGDPRAIRLRAQGADSLALDAQGDVLLRRGSATIRMRRPDVYQEVRGARQGVAGRFVRRGTREIGFEIGAYDLSQPLVIDPVVLYSTYLGGSGTDEANDLFIDASGSFYLTGKTDSSNFPKLGAAQGTFGGGFSDAFVTKFDPTAAALVFSTYLGGNNEDYANAVRVDTQGNVYVAGGTRSSNFPVTPGAVQTTFGGGNIGGDAFVAKLNAAGSAIVYATFLGGSDTDGARDLAVDVNGNAVLVGSTRSNNFPATPAALQRTFGGGAGNTSGFGGDGFVAEIDPTGAALLYATYLGGSDEDRATSVKLDAFGNALVAGFTRSNNFHTTAGVFQTAYAGGTFDGDVFLAKINPQGTALVFSTYLGGSGDDRGGALAFDASGNILLVGQTESTNFPTASPLQATNHGRGDVFLAKLSPSANALLYSTYFGGSGTDFADLLLDPSGNIYLIGNTDSLDLPLSNPLQPYFGDSDLFVAKINGATMALLYSTYLGGSEADIPGGVAVDPSGTLWVSGSTFSIDFPLVGAFQNTFGGGFDDAFLLKLSDANPPQTGPAADLSVSITASRSQVDPGDAVDYTVTITNAGPDAAASVLMTDPLPFAFSFSSVTASQGTCSSSSTGRSSIPTLVSCNLGSLNSGGSATVTIRGRGASNTGFSGPFRNTARAFAATRDPAPGNNSGSVTLTLGTPPSDGNGGGTFSGSGCFIATAAFGSPLHPHVQALREFRDRHLLSSAPGRAFVRFYYRVSPPLAAVIARHASLRLATRIVLVPVILSVENPVHTSIVLALGGVLLWMKCKRFRSLRNRLSA